MKWDYFFLFANEGKYEMLSFLYSLVVEYLFCMVVRLPLSLSLSSSFFLSFNAV